MVRRHRVRIERVVALGRRERGKEARRCSAALGRVGERRVRPVERQDDKGLERLDPSGMRRLGAAERAHVGVNRVPLEQARRRRRLDNHQLDLLRIERRIERDLVPRLSLARCQQDSDAHQNSEAARGVQG